MPTVKSPLYLKLRKHKEALASIEVHRRWIERLETRAKELKREIAELGGFPPPKKLRLKFQGRGVMQKRMFAMIREVGHVTAPMLARALLEEFIPKPHTPTEVRAMRERVYQCIRRNEERGIVRFIGGIGKGRDFKRYGLAQPPHA